MDISISNVVEVSVSQASLGANAYNTSNLGLFTDETPNGSFGTRGYKAYVEPTDVATDFGSTSRTYKCALAVFSQQPNILTGGGQLIVVKMLDNMPAVTAVQLLTFSTVPTTGSYKLKYGADTTAAIGFDDDATVVEDELQGLTGLGSVTVTGDTTVGFTVTFTGVSGPAALLQVLEDSLQDTSGFDVFVQPTTTVPGVAAGSAETLAAAITRTSQLVQYFGIMETANVTEQTEADVLASAAVVQALNKIAFFVAYLEADIQSGGIIDELRTGGLSQSRGLYYGDTDTPENSIYFMAAYAGRALSTVFEGSNTTQNMHLKNLAGIQPDPTIDQTILDEAQDAGADCYVLIDQFPNGRVFASGQNFFFDQVYNLRWIVGALQIAAVNILAQTSTKIPQTESGMNSLKGVLSGVCQQAVTNGYAAPGEWTSPTKFGNPDSLVANIRQLGFYIFSQPVSQQSQADRAARKAPLVQIALKEAGAIDSATIIVNINQ
jgi:hypothetical protein